MIDQREYSIDFRNEPARTYLVGGTYVRPTTDYRQSALGERMFNHLRQLIAVERKLISETENVDSRKVHNAVARSLSYVARRVVTTWEGHAVEYEAPDARELLAIERQYYVSLMSNFDEEAIASLGKVGGMPISEFYRDVVKAGDTEVDIQTRYASRAAEVLGGFSQKYLPVIRERISEIDAELSPQNPATFTPAP
ncbi:hypothetical protein GOB57_22350 [Sinorhizobium meliloti]|nr:hypothetical protein [Sinorhizobium meliloti]